MRQRSHVFWQVALGCDTAVLIGSFFAAYAIRSTDILTSVYGDLYPIDKYLWALWVIVPTWLWLFRRYHLHQQASFDSPGLILVRLGKAQALGGLILLASVYLIDRLEVSRLLTQMFIAISACLLVAEKLALRALLKWVEGRRGLVKRWRVLVVGSDAKAQEKLHLLRDHPNGAVDLIGPVSLDTKLLQVAVNGNGAVRQPGWETMLREDVVDEVVAVTAWHDAPRTRELARACAERGITFRILVTMPPTEFGRYYVEEVDYGSYLMSLETVPQGTLSLALKRLIDIAGALVGLALCGVAYLWYGPKIRTESPGPVLFRQQRVGQNGRTFTLYKFRTMCPDAERKLAELRPRNEMRGLMFKIKEDPRVTPLGKVLRRRHIDEFPQFWNVLKGEMSLVGTRPPTPDEVARYSPHHYRRLSMKPGLTGLWQLNGNGEVSDFEEVVRLDCKYIDNWSLWLDCRILGKTAAKVLRGNAW